MKTLSANSLLAILIVTTLLCSCKQTRDGNSSLQSKSLDEAAIEVRVELENHTGTNVEVESVILESGDQLVIVHLFSLSDIDCCHCGFLSGSLHRLARNCVCDRGNVHSSIQFCRRFSEWQWDVRYFYF